MRNNNTRQVFLAFTDQGVCSMTNFLTGVIIGRVCTKEQLGLYTLGFSLVFLALTVQNSLVSLPYTVHAAPLHQDSSCQVYNGSTLIHQLVLSALISFFLILFGIILWFTDIGARGLNQVIWALAATMSMILFRQYARRIYFARLRIEKSILLDLCVAVLQVGGILLLAHLRILSAFGAFLVTGIACASIAIISFSAFLKMFRFQLANVKSTFRLHWTFGRWLLASGLIMTVATQSYLWLLSYFHGPSSTGTFGACMAAVFLMNPLITGTSNYIDPKSAHVYAEGGIEELRRIVLKAAALLGIGAALFTLLLFGFGEWFLAVMYGDKYAGNGLIVTVLAVSNVSILMSVPANSGLMAIKQTHIFNSSSIIALFVTIAFGSWFVMQFSALGAAVGMALAMWTSSIFRWIALSRAIGIEAYEGGHR
ncbi:MAG TPA: polysaccharide biosynthesis C-terminal domain-containing protein [Nitrososphaera sp.]|nr:polysaccharide biosynthesis C-terminal domain-containing protein [Nitrososphaera sp.]